jgi:predicted SnoaL-like aldol condensation-catalyzing enzyme
VPVKSVDDLKSLMRRFVDEFQSNSDEAVADELLADIFRNHTAPPGMSPGKQGVKAYFAAFRRAVPDLHAQVHDMLADGAKVVTRARSPPGYLDVHTLLVQQPGAPRAWVTRCASPLSCPTG